MKMIKLVREMYVGVKETIPDEEGNIFKGVLCKLVPGIKDVFNVVGPDTYVEIEGMSVEPNMSTEHEVVMHFNNDVVKRYFSQQNVHGLRDLSSDKNAENFVLTILHAEKFTYGQTIDVTGLFNKYGLATPTIDNPRYTTAEYYVYIRAVNTVSKVLVRLLKNLGFGADRNKDNTYDHDDANIIDGCRNVIWTRYPWSSVFKMNKTVRAFISMARKDFYANQDLGPLKKYDEGLHQKTIDMVGKLNVSAIGFTEAADDSFYDGMKDYKNSFIDLKDDLVFDFKKLRPDTYQKFLD